MEHPYIRPMLLAPSPTFLRFIRQWQQLLDRGVRVSPSIQFAQTTLWRRQFQNCRIAFEPTDRFTASAGIESFHEIGSGDVKSTDEMLYHIGNLLLDVDMVAEAAARQEFGSGFLSRSVEFSGFTIGCMTEQLPNPDSRVLLSESKDRFGQRRVSVDLRLTDEDRLSAGRFVTAMSEAFGRVGIGRVRVLVPERFEHWPPRIISYGSHHMGTTRMSTNPRTGVVDTDLRLHQAGNIFVAGSSVFPTGSHVPPTLTIVALALRLSDHLRATLP
jgi:choline dehydrogenase-like flavoprotein